MFNSPIFETIISLVFIILIFSVLVSCVQEGVVSIFKQRGKMLQFAIKEMLDDRLNKNFAYLLYQHPQIDLLKKKQSDLPSYISAENFASALVDLIASESVETIYKKEGDTIVKKEVLKTQLFRHSPAFREFAGDIDPSDERLLNINPGVIPVAEKFKAGVDSLKESDLKQLLQSFAQANTSRDIVAEAAGNIQDLKKNIEKWYTLYMERVTGWYKRKIRKNIFFASAVVTLAFNLNFITISKAIYADSNLRGPIASMAINATKDTTFIDNVRIKLLGKDSTLFGVDVSKVIGAELPIGWKPAKPGLSTDSWWKRTRTQIGDFFEKEFTLKNIAGWLLFILALSLGAPFWFDMLKKIVNIRNSGASPVERKEK